MPRGRFPRELLEACSFLLMLLTVLPLPYADPFLDLRDIIKIYLCVLVFLTSIPNPPPDNYLVPIMQRLDPVFNGFPYRGRDIFVAIENQRYLFWLNTGELPETLLDVTSRISRNLSRLNRRGRRRQRIRRFKLNNINKVLLTFMWLRKYPCIDTLALFFDISPTTVSAIIHGVVPVLWRFFSNQVSWPTNAEWNTLRGTWPTFPDAVGCIDGTPHEIYRPEVEPQREFYSGHRHYHLMNKQLIVDALGNIVFLQAGFLGAMNDAGNYMLMERIGPGTNYDMPNGAVLLADKGYADVVPLLTPFRAAQVRRLSRHDQMRARRFNRRMSRCRILIEHTISYMKTYKAIGSIWRHPRWFQPVVVELCTFLAQRHVVLFHDIS